MKNHAVTSGVATGGLFLMLAVFAAGANAASLRKGSTSENGAVIPSLPGRVLWTYFQGFDNAFFCSDIPPDSMNYLCNNEGNGDNIIRLINPNGNPNVGLGGGSQAVCAMFYIFDDAQEMNECCGCPISSAGILTFSIADNLTSNWAGVGDVKEPTLDNPINAYGAIAIVAASANPSLVAAGPNSNGQGCIGAQGLQCNSGCDPTNVPGYTVTAANDLLGSIVHNQGVQAGPPTGFDLASGLTETALFEDGGGDLTNLSYLQAQCGALIGNSTGAGICNCPTE
jgi:hypothetical protein